MPNSVQACQLILNMLSSLAVLPQISRKLPDWFVPAQPDYNPAKLGSVSNVGAIESGTTPSRSIGVPARLAQKVG